MCSCGRSTPLVTFFCIERSIHQRSCVCMQPLCMLRQKSLSVVHDCLHDCYLFCTIVTGSQEAYRRLMKCNARSVSKKFQTLKTSTALEGIPSLCHVFRRVPSVGDQDKSFDRLDIENKKYRMECTIVCTIVIIVARL